MTREKLYSSIYTNDTIYLPPAEESSAPLEVTLGCSWGKCTFCDFARDAFRVIPRDRLIDNMKILNELQPDNHRMFCLGENPFGLDYDYLCDLLQLAHTHMPNIKEFAMYARIDDILRKSKEELVILKSFGLTDLHIGIESGSDPILEYTNKGVTSKQILRGLHLLNTVGIGYYITIIIGLGGKTFSCLHALETARLLNQVHPRSIWCLSLILWKDTPLYKQEKQGLFEMMTPKEMLLEERLLIENLEVENCLYTDTTVLQTYTIRGQLPQQKQLLLDAVNQLILMH